MKLLSRTFSGLAFCILAGMLAAQEPISLKESKITFNHGEYEGFVLNIPEVEYAAVSKSWIKKLEKGTKSKTAIEDGEISIFGAQIDEVYLNPINIYSVLSSLDSTVQLEVTIELKPKEFISREQSEKEFAQAKLFLFEFGKEQYADFAKDELKREEKKLKELERDYSSLQNSKEKLEKSIIIDENRITSNEDKIVLLKQDAQTLNDRIGREKAILLDLTEPDSKDAKQEEIKSAEKAKSKALKESENLQKKIVESKSAIGKAKLDIESNLREQSSKLEEIDIQKAEVVKYTNKYNAILEMFM